MFFDYLLQKFWCADPTLFDLPPLTFAWSSTGILPHMFFISICALSFLLLYTPYSKDAYKAIHNTQQTSASRSLHNQQYIDVSILSKQHHLLYIPSSIAERKSSICAGISSTSACITGSPDTKCVFWSSSRITWPDHPHHFFTVLRL